MAIKDISINELSADIRSAIAELKKRPEIEETGIVTRVGDGVVWIYGLTSAGFNEMIELDGSDGTSITAFAFNLGEDEIGAVLLGDDTKIKAGTRAHLTGRVLEVPIGPELVGRVVDPLGARWTAKAPSRRRRPRRSRKSLPVCCRANRCTNR